MTNNFTDYGLAVKHRLLDMGKTQRWLEDEITNRTGLFMDSSYMSRILTGRNKPPKVLAAMNEILGITADGKSDAEV